jgi:aryl-alcohol dehydrogenase-like predicted oxidoreductase
VIRHIGLSNVTTEQLRAARRIVEIAAVTAHYNVVDRHESALLDAAVEAGAVFSPWQPVSLTVPGAPTDTGGSEAVRRVVGPVADRHGATTAQVALAWLLARSPAILPVPGTTGIGHVRENLAAQDLVLSPDEIRAITALVPQDAAAPAGDAPAA